VKGFAVSDERTAEIAGRLEQVRDRISAACVAAGRSPDEVTLVAVTKTYPADDVVRLASLGVTEVGENRDQEAGPKAAAVATLSGGAAGPNVRWHFVGHLQRNKCRSVVQYADVIHSVDSVRLAVALCEAAKGRERPLEVLVQASLDGDTARGGATAANSDSFQPAVEVERVAEVLASADPTIALKGIMAVAPMGWEPERAFAELHKLAESLRSLHPSAGWISAGMSGDLEQAVKYGSTHVRVGSALLGNRPALG
jgi:pyridoxal phosphate enzyme (YggS family)